MDKNCPIKDIKQFPTAVRGTTKRHNNKMLRLSYFDRITRNNYFKQILYGLLSTSLFEDFVRFIVMTLHNL